VHFDFVRAVDDASADLSMIETPQNRHSYAVARFDDGIQFTDIGGMAVAGIDLRQRVRGRYIDADHPGPHRMSHDQPVPVCWRAQSVKVGTHGLLFRISGPANCSARS